MLMSTSSLAHETGNNVFGKIVKENEKIIIVSTQGDKIAIDPLINIEEDKSATYEWSWSDLDPTRTTKLTICGVGLSVMAWQAPICVTSLGAATGSCVTASSGITAPACVASVASAALSCGVSVASLTGIIQNCFK